MRSAKLKCRDRSLIPLLVAAGLSALLAGCEALPDTSSADNYQPPPPGAPVAYLKGTSIKEEGFFGSEHRGFATMVDLKSIPDAADHWNDPIALTPGAHTITAEYRYSNFMALAYLPVEIRAGANYELMIKSSHDDTPDGRLYNDFWIEDLATGRPVTPVYHRQATGGKKGTIFYQNK